MPRSPTAGSRRAFLLSGTLGAGALLAGCARDKPAPEKNDPAAIAGDVALLNQGLDLEHLAVAAYDLTLDTAAPATRALVRRIRQQEREHAAALAQAVRDLGGSPRGPRPASEYRRGFPRLRAPADALRFAQDVENTQVAAYIDTLPKLSDPDLRARLATIVTNEAEHLALLARHLGQNPVPVAFVTGHKVEQVTDTVGG